MVFKNSHVIPARRKNTGREGNSAPYANMPANNVGEHSISLGSGKNSTFGAGVNSGAAQMGAAQSSKAKNGANMSANNVTNNGPAMGTTKHAVGTVPKYLRSK